MSISVGYDGKFLESTSNLSEVLKKSLGRNPSFKVAKDSAVCLQHGRLFFEAAEKSPMEIKPLLIFYGMVNFAKSLVIARNLKQLETLNQKHGVRDISETNSKLEELKVKILDEGTFQEFNDTVCILDCISFRRTGMTERLNIPTSKSVFLKDKYLTLKDILARIPGLGPLYSATFSEEPKNICFNLGYMDKDSGSIDLRIDDKEIFKDIKSRISITDKLKKKYAFLKKWYLTRAELAWDHSILIYTNVNKKSIKQLSKQVVEEKDGSYYIQQGPLKDLKCDYVNFWEILDPSAAGITNREYLIEPFDGIHISELSLYYLGMFLLSSLVRYRPQIWCHSISRLVTSDSPSDDKALALIERFMKNAISTFSSTIVDAMSIRT